MSDPTTSGPNQPWALGNSKQNPTAREVFGEPYPAHCTAHEFGTAFYLRIGIVLTMVTIPTAITLWSRLPNASNPLFAQAGVHLWSGLALTYASTLVIGTLLFRQRLLSYHLGRGLTALCLALEVSLTATVSYLTGIGADGFAVACFITVIILFYRLYLKFSP